MSKEEFLKIQKCVLKVNIHCDGCKQKVKKILQKIDGVFTTEIDAEQGKVTVSGNVDPNVLIKKLAKSGKHAELWGAPSKSNNNNNNNQNHLANQLKNMQINHPKGGGNNNQHHQNNNKGQNQKGGNNQPQPPKGGGGGGGQQGPNPQQQQQQLQLQLQQQQRLQQQLQQLQQMKGFQDLNLPQFKDLKFPPQNPNPNAKAVKFDIPEEDEEFTDDEEYDDDEDDFDDEFDEDDEMDVLPPSKMKAPPMMMNAPKGINNGGGGGGGNNGKKGPAPVPVQMHGFPGANANGGGKKGGGGGGGNNQNHGGSAPDGKNKNNNGNNAMGNNNNNMGGKKGNNPMGGVGVGVGVGVQPMHGGFQNMGGPPRVMSQPNVGPMSMPMPNIPAVQGLPATVNSGGYFQGGGPGAMPGNPFHQQQQQQLQQHQQQQQQQYMAAMMNQQRAMGNERFQPMMYERPPPAVNYMYPPYPYPPPDPYTHYFSDENTSSCNVM